MAETIGEKLRKARLEKNLTLDQVFLAIHIRQRYLTALEENQRELLPSAVQGRGFLGMYADYLGIPSRPLLDAWEAGRNELIDEAPATSVPNVIHTDAFDIEKPVQPEEAEPDDPTEVNENFIEESKTDPGHASSSQVILTEIGASLKQKRETLGLSLEDIEQNLHIRLRYLISLEDGKIDELPSLAQARGMMNNYSHFLEMDSEKLLLRYADALQSRRMENKAVGTLKPDTVPRKDTRPRNQPAASRQPVWQRFLTPDLLIGSLIILVFVGFAVWSASQVIAIRQQQQQVVPPSIAQILLATATPPELTLAATEVTESVLNTPAEGDQTNQEEVPGGDEPTIVPTLDDLPLQVYVVANQRAWMRILVDGKQAFNGRIVPGNAYPFSGKDKIELSTGNAAGLQVYYNQQSLGSLGITGQVVSLIFTKKGVVTPTPSFSPSPTFTKPPTVTLQPSPTQRTATITPLIP
jgi:cytoskeleton protein RodZ